ncbi:MAG: FmdB family zinc ribbon protein [Terriglobia bacterium]
MPLYEYECTSCGKRFELIQKFSDPPEMACTACGQQARRLLSAPAFQFKGSGWYVTDYARKAAPAEKSDGKAEDESKPETKTAEEAASQGKKKKEEKKPAASASEKSE